MHWKSSHVIWMHIRCKWWSIRKRTCFIILQWPPLYLMYMRIYYCFREQTLKCWNIFCSLVVLKSLVNNKDVIFQNLNKYFGYLCPQHKYLYIILTLNDVTFHHTYTLTTNYSNLYILTVGRCWDVAYIYLACIGSLSTKNLTFTL